MYQQLFALFFWPFCSVAIQNVIGFGQIHNKAALVFQLVLVLRLLYKLIRTLRQRRCLENCNDIAKAFKLVPLKVQVNFGPSQQNHASRQFLNTCLHCPSQHDLARHQEALFIFNSNGVIFNSMHRDFIFFNESILRWVFL